MQTSVVVTGMGIISSIGHNAGEFEEALQAGRSGIGFLKSKPQPPISVTIGAEITGMTLEPLLQQYEGDGAPGDFIHQVMLSTYDTPPGIQASVISTLEAWQQAQLFKKPLAAHRLGIVAAGSNLSQNYHYGLLLGFQAAPRYLTPKYAFQYMDTDHVGTLSEIFKIQGEGFTVGGSSASGNAAIIKASQSIQSGNLDACVVVGPMADLSPLELQGFYNLGAMGGKRYRDQPGKACRPFDKDREGFIYGQAAGALVLESADSAQKRGIPILAEIGGGAIVLEGNRLPTPNARGEARAMETALLQAGLKPGDIDYLNAHATSSPRGDETEIQAIKQVFKDNLTRLWINSSKALTGHCLGAAGLIESIAVIIQLQKGFIHPNLNLENPIDDQCRFSPAQSVKTPVNIALNNSFGFAGINTSVVFKRKQ